MFFPFVKAGMIDSAEQLDAKSSCSKKSPYAKI